MALKVSLTPARGMPHFSSLVFPTISPQNQVLTTGGGVVTLTPAQVLSGLILADCQDAQTANLPTAALLNAALPGVAVGSSFFLDIVNYGDTTLTIGLGTGITKTTIATVAPVMTIATLCTKRFLLVCTAVGAGTVADAWVVYAFGSTAAAVA
jgi:hypothetical protein